MDERIRKFIAGIRPPYSVELPTKREQRDEVDSLPCGHPPQCATLVAGEVDCEWCDEVDSLEATYDDLKERFFLLEKTNETLRQIIEKKAVIVNDGSPTIEGPIGYLEIRGGSVHMHSLTCSTVGAVASDTRPRHA